MGIKNRKNRIPEDFFFSCVFWRNFHRNMVLERSQEFLILDTISGIFCRNSCGTGIPVFSPDSSGFLQDSCSCQIYGTTNEGFLLTGIRLWAQICAHLNFELHDCLITFPIFVLSQRLIARNVRELFSFNRGVSYLNETCRIDDVSRGSLSCYEILTNN